MWSEEPPAYVLPAVDWSISCRMAALQQQEVCRLVAESQHTAALYLCAGQRKDGQQHQHEDTQAAGTARLLPVLPPEHDELEGCYYWTGSRTYAAYSEPLHAAAASAGDGNGRPGSSAPQQHRDSSSMGGAAGTGSMDTSATTRVVLQSAGHSEMFSTARNPAQTWGPALSRLKQLQQQTVAALLCVEQQEEQVEG